MSETLNLPRLISELAARTNCSPAEARRFIHDFFALIETSLAEGKTVEIKDLGQFTPSADIDNPVLFQADTQLAALVNEPFAVFEATEIADGVELDEPAPAEESTREIAPAVPSPEAEAVNEENQEEITEEIPEKPVVESVPEPVAEEVVAEPHPQENVTVTEEEVAEEEPAPAPTPTPAPAPAPVPEVVRVITKIQPAPKPNHGMWLVLGVLIGLLLGLCIGFFAGKSMGQYIFPDDTDEVPDSIETIDTDSLWLALEAETAAPADNAPSATEPAVAPEPQNEVTPAPENAPAPAASAPAPVYDTITSSSFLTTLAGKHYGVKNWWIFIYEANPELGDPNKVRPGTRVLIPARESFEEATREQTNAKAQRLLNNLAKKYKL